MTKSFIIPLTALLFLSGCTEDFFKPHSSKPTAPGQSTTGTQKPGNDPASKETFIQCMHFDEMTGTVDESLDETTCSDMADALKSQKENQGVLLTDAEVLKNIQAGASFPAALSMNSNAIQKMFNASSIWATAPGAQIDLTGCQVAGFPQNAFSDVLTKNNCFVARFDMTVNGYKGKVKLAIPLVATSDKTKISISADMSKARFLKFETTQMLDAYMGTVLETAAKNGLKPYLVNVPLFDMTPWKLGQNNLKLFVAQPQVHITNAYQAVEIGMYTNLDIPSSGVEIPSDAKHGIDVGLHIHPEWMRAVVGRMMTEDNGGKPVLPTQIKLSAESVGAEDQPEFEITQTNMSDYPDDQVIECADYWKTSIPMGYRLWSTKKYCSYRDLLVGLQVDIKDKTFIVTTGSIDAGMRKGASSLKPAALENLESTDFMKSAATFVNQTVEAQQIMTISTKNKVSFEATAATMSKTRQGFSFYSNLKGI